MRPVKIVLFCLLLFYACKCNSGKDRPVAEDSILIIPDTLLAYDVDAESKIIKRYTEVPDSAFTAQRVVNGLNEKYTNVRLQLLRQSNDTLYVTVTDAEYLGERMGSTGSAAWYADAVLNLTAVPGIHFVNIQLEEGSHASPGVFSRTDYPDYKIDSTSR